MLMDDERFTPNESDAVNAYNAALSLLENTSSAEVYNRVLRFIGSPRICVEANNLNYRAKCHNPKRPGAAFEKSASN